MPEATPSPFQGFIERRIARFVKGQLKLHNFTYKQLAERLALFGFRETDASIANKLMRGKFSAAFFFATMSAINTNEVNVREVISNRVEF